MRTPQLSNSLRTITAAITLCAATFALAPAADAQTSREPKESKRSMMLELNFGFYTPDIDSEFGRGGATPYANIFGSSSMTQLGMALDYEVYKGFGTLAVGGSWRYGWVNGNAISSDGTKSVDETGLKMFPMTFFLTYRWDWAQVHYNVPLVPYVRLGMTWAIWWSTDAKGRTSNWLDPTGTQRVARGGTWGWQVAGGLQFLLDILAEDMALDMDEETGINNTYIFGEVQYQQLDDFGSNRSLNLGATSFHFGLKFEF